MAKEALGSFSLDFNLKSGETLVITDMRGEEVFSCALPRMDDAYVLALDMRNGGYIGKKR